MLNIIIFFHVLFMKINFNFRDCFVRVWKLFTHICGGMYGEDDRG